MSKDNKGNKNAPAKTAEVKETAKPAAETVAKTEKVAETKPEIVMVTSTDLANKLGTKGTILRRWLRTLPQFQDAGYTRYKWEPTDPFLEIAEESFKKFQASDSEKKAKRLEEAREKAEKKEAAKATEGEKKSKKAPVEPELEETESDEDEDFEDDEEGEELE